MAVSNRRKLRRGSSEADEDVDHRTQRERTMQAASDIAIGLYSGPKSAAEAHGVVYRSLVAYYIKKFNASGAQEALREYEAEVSAGASRAFRYLSPNVSFPCVSVRINSLFKFPKCSMRIFLFQ